MFMSMQNLNGDSYQGAQVGANMQSQVGATHRNWGCEPEKTCQLAYHPHYKLNPSPQHTDSDIDSITPSTISLIIAMDD